MTTLTVGTQTNVDIQPGQVLTVTGNGSAWIVPYDANRQPLTPTVHSGGTTTVGPFVTVMILGVLCRSGTVDTMVTKAVGTGGGGGSTPVASALVRQVAASGANQLVTTIGLVDPVYDITLTANCTLTFEAQVGSPLRQETITVYLRQDATGGRTVAVPSGVAWSSGVAPSFSTQPGRYDVVQFVTINGGASWLGSMIAYGVVVPSVPSAPTLTVTGGATKNTLTVNDTGNGGSPITAHKIYRGLATDSLALIATVPIADGNTYTDNGLTNGTTYYYEAVSVNAIGSSPRSAQATGIPTNAPTTRLNFPANPNSAYYTDPNNAYVPGAAILDVAAQMSFANWGVAKGSIVGPWDIVANKLCWVFLFSAASPGRPMMRWQTASGSMSATATVAVPFAANVVGYVRGTINPATGNATFYTSVDGVDWAQLGAVVAGTAGNIIASGSGNAFLVGGQFPSGQAGSTGEGYLTACQVYAISVIVGSTTVANPVFAGKAAGTTTFNDAQSRAWSIVAPAAIVNP